MKKLLRFLTFGIAISPVTLALALTGCNQSHHPAYSPAVKYGVRTDPIKVTSRATDLGDDRYEPDRPGVFPLIKIEDVFEADHPYYVKIKEKLAPPLNKAINDDKLPEDKRKLLQDKLMRDPNQRKTLAPELDAIFRNPAALAEKERKELADALEACFGTPANPVVKGEYEDDNGVKHSISEETIKKLKLEATKLAMGSTRYRIHCLHCHGVTGDGRGPTARWINPHPRDFRAGKFKFSSVNQVGPPRPPSRDDLMRTLRVGLEGTAMPSFNLLGNDELDALVSYVMHLSIRGAAEASVFERLQVKDGVLKWSAEEELTIADRVNKTAVDLAQDQSAKDDEQKRINISWLASQDPKNWIKVEPYPYTDLDNPKLDEDARKKAIAELRLSVKRGKEMFTQKPSPEFIKEYSTRLRDKDRDDIRKKVEALKLAPKEEADELAKKTLEKAENTLKAPNCVSCHVDYGRQAKFRFDDWGTLTRPNNFTAGVFRGGKRPVDIYYRIHSGITPSGMTNFGGVLQGQDIWDLVNFVSSVSFPPMRKTLEISID